MQARRQLDLPESVSIVGSFQKDGDGWDDGKSPKWIKGPDILLKTLGRLKEKVPDLFILLSGPARGYVRQGLQDLKVPHKHIYLEEYADIGTLFQALDLYLVTSRQEGGPKAILETMASGVPLVTTRVGQAMDLVEHGVNGWIVEPEDAEGLAYWAEHVLSTRESEEIGRMTAQAYKTAQNNSYEAQQKLWSEFFRGYVETM